MKGDTEFMKCSSKKLIVLCVLLLGLGSVSAYSDSIRLVNGKEISGTVEETTKEGLKIKTRRGIKSYRWVMLSPATRFRHQEIYRLNFAEILKGLPEAEWKKKKK